MDLENDLGLPSSSSSTFRDSTSSLYSAPWSISSFHNKYSSISRSLRPRSEANAQQSISNLKSLLDILFTNQIPGPKLIRLEREFCTPLGHGGQGNVYGVSIDFEKNVLELQDQTNDERLKYSASYWTKCVVKHLRSDQRRNDVEHAFREISRLCQPSLRGHPNIVRLVSWGISLDALEAANLESLCTPLLILEKAHCDLAQFIQNEEYATVPYETMCDLSIDIGRGLGAVHSANIVHGDLKLENILIFTGSHAAGRKWTAKLCDFGSAVPISARTERRDSTTYLGSKTWLPPECYEKSLVGQPLPPSLAPCDIFVYGLVVWAMFIGIHFSPLYNIQKVDGHGADIVRHIGQQRFYARARDSVIASFSHVHNNVQFLLAAFTEQTLTHCGGRAGRQTSERRLQRRWQARAFDFGQVPSNEEDKVNRILLVLRESLNDSPDRRDLQPWRYLDKHRYPIVPRVENPPKFMSKYETQHLSRVETPAVADLWSYLLKRISHSRPWVITRDRMKQFKPQRIQSALTTIQQVSKTSLSYITSLRLLRTEGRRYRLWKQYVRQATRYARSEDFAPFEYLEHPYGSQHRRCEPLRLHFEYLRLQRGDAALRADMLYAWARLRSHYRLCCWQKACKTFPLATFGVKQVLVDQQLPVDVSVLAWLCRGEIGHHDMQQMNRRPALIWHKWSSTQGRTCSDSVKTNIFLLLLEQGFHIHERAIRGSEERVGTPFMCFLQSLKQPEHALDVAVHFERMAKEETTLRAKRYYLTGRVSDLDTEEDHKNVLLNRPTTALHDAVGAGNYPLVEFLVATRFNLSAVDFKQQTAYELASTINLAPLRSEMNSIRALLEQSGPRQKMTKTKSASPLGWTEMISKDNRSNAARKPNNSAATMQSTTKERFKAWRETSIEGDFDAITFIGPKTGLYESDRLTLGRIQGEDKIYRLDPLRFLKSTSDKEVARKPASKPKFDEEWYRADIRAVEQPLPLPPLPDARAWIRYPARGLQFARERHGTLVFMVLSLLSLVARSLLRPRLELLLAVIAVSFFSFGFSPAGVWVGTAFVIPKKYYGSNLWSNAPELLLGISAVARGETTLAKSSLIGFILCNALWVFGISLFCVGCTSYQIVSHRFLYTTTGLCLLASAFSSVLVWFDIIVGDTEMVPPSQDKTVFLSRSIAIASLLLWASFLAFRNQTHAHLFEPQYSEQRSISDRLSRSPIESVIQALIRLVFLGLCADNMIHSLLLQPILARKMCIYFAIPLTARVWAQYRGVRSGWDDMGHAFEEVIDSSIGTVLNTLLCVGPCLVLLGGIIGSPMDLRFSVMEITLVDVAVWTLSVSAAVEWYAYGYFRGVSLMTLYVLSALGLYFTL